MTIRFRVNKLWGKVWKDIFILPTIQVTINNPLYMWKNLRITIGILVFLVCFDFVLEGEKY